MCVSSRKQPETDLEMCVQTYKTYSILIDELQYVLSHHRCIFSLDMPRVYQYRILFELGRRHYLLLKSLTPDGNTEEQTLSLKHF